MKRAVVLTLVVCGFGLVKGSYAADSSASSNYDPQIDGLTPPIVSSPDLSILDDQKKLYEKNSPAPAKPAKPAASAPATAPAATPTAPATPAAPAGQ